MSEDRYVGAVRCSDYEDQHVSLLSNVWHFGTDILILELALFGFRWKGINDRPRPIRPIGLGHVLFNYTLCLLTAGSGSMIGMMVFVTSNHLSQMDCATLT